MSVLRRIFVVCIVLVALAVGLLFLLPQIVSTQMVQQQVASHASQLTGFKVEIDGDTSISVFPTLNFKIRGVSLRAGASKGPPVAVMDELGGNVDLLPLLKGEISVRSFTLIRPRFSFISTSDGTNNWASARLGDLETVVAQRQTEGVAERRFPIGNIRILEGTAEILQPEESAARLEGINAIISWPATNAAISAEGLFILNGTKIDFSGGASDLIGLLSGGQSDLSAKFTSSLGAMSVEGLANTQAEFQLAGKANIQSSKTRALLAWMNIPVGTGSGLNELALEGDLNLVGTAASFSPVKLTIDNNVSEGVLKIGEADGRWFLKGTLAAEAVNLGHYLARPNETSHGNIDLGLLAPYDIDLRLSAASIKAGEVAIGRSALSITSRDENFQIAIGEATLFGGMASGTVSGKIGGGRRPLPINTSFQAKGMQLAPLMAAMGFLPQMNGKLNANLNLEGNGINFDMFKRTMSGQGHIDVTGATLSGVDLRRIIGLMLKTGTGTPSATGGQTAFSAIGSKFNITNGVAWTHDLKAEGNGLRVLLTSRYDIVTGFIRGHGRAELGESGEGKPPPTGLPILISGTIDKPAILPDPDWMLKPENETPGADAAAQ